MWTKKSKILFVLYKLTAQWLPISQHSSLSKKMREFFGKRIAEKFGRNGIKALSLHPLSPLAGL